MTFSRRDVLAGGGAALAATAGCSSLPTLGGDGSDGDDERDFAWFGPEVVGAKWSTHDTPPAEVPSESGIGRHRAYHPGRMDADVLGSYADRFSDDQGVWSEYTIPETAIETLVITSFSEFALISGSLDTAAIGDALESEAVRTESFDGGTVYARAESRGDVTHSGVAVTDEHLAFVLAPSEEAAVDLPRAFVETRLGDRPRYHEQSDLLERVLGHLPSGFHYSGGWRPVWRREWAPDEWVTSGPNMTSYRIDDESVRMTRVRWLEESERGEDAAAREADLEANENYEDVSVTYDGALRIVDAREPNFVDAKMSG